MQGHYLVVPADAAVCALLPANEAAQLATTLATEQPGTRWLVCAVLETRDSPINPADDHGERLDGPAPRDLAASAGPSPTESSVEAGLPQRCAPHAHQWAGQDYRNRFTCEHCFESVKRSELPHRAIPPSVDNLPARLLPTPTNGGCPLPPAGWWCSRPKGHDGPCPARPLPADFGVIEEPVL